jgi:hypothetical protein
MRGTQHSRLHLPHRNPTLARLSYPLQTHEPAINISSVVVIITITILASQSEQQHTVTLPSCSLFLLSSLSTLKMLSLLLTFLFPTLAQPREITFPPSSGYASNQILLNGYTDPDISGPKFAGLETFANLPYVHCLGNGDVEEFDIAVLGAPFDTVSLIDLLFL